MFTDTTVGKTLKTLVYLVISNVIATVAVYVSGHQELFNPYVVSIVNLVAVLGKNFLDPQVKNI